MTKVIKTTYDKGQRFTTSSAGLDLKVIAKAENYLMVRYIGCAPMCIHVKAFKKFLFKIGGKIKIK